MSLLTEHVMKIGAGCSHITSQEQTLIHKWNFEMYFTLKQPERFGLILKGDMAMQMEKGFSNYKENSTPSIKVLMM